jgi:hypothetical protein
MHSGTYTVNVGRYTSASASGYQETPEDFQVHFNGDFSGDIWVDLRLRQAADRLDVQHIGDADSLYTVKLPYYLLEQIVMDKLRQDLVSKIEQMESSEFKELLKLVLF